MIKYDSHRHLHYMTIAGMSIQIASRRPPSSFETAPLSYRPFFSDNIPANATLFGEIDISDADLPVIPAGDRVFDSGSAWSVHRKGNLLQIVMAPPGSAAPLWIAEFSPQSRQIPLYCGPETLDGKGRLLYDPTRYPLDQIVLMHLWAESGKGGIFHAAGCLYNNDGWVFAGVSGAGKSTISTLLARTGGWSPVSDDRVVIRKAPGGYRVYGTPWPGEAGFAENRGKSLKGIFLLEKGKENRIEPIPKTDAAAGLLPLLSVPWYDARLVDQMLGFCDQLIAEVPVFRLVFRPDGEVAEKLDVFTRSECCG